MILHMVRVLCILIFFVGVVYFSKIDSIELKIDSSLTQVLKDQKLQQKIKAHLNIYKGIWIWKVNLKNITRELNKIYPVGNIYISRRLPNRMIVFLERADPIAIILKDNHTFFAVSYNGVIRHRLDYHQPLNWPILRGKLLWKNQELRIKIIDFLSFLPQKGLLTASNISEIKYNKKNDSFLLYLISKNFIVEWKGKLDAKKIKNINFVLNYMSPNEYPHKYRIDARFSKKIIVNKLK